MILPDGETSAVFNPGETVTLLAVPDEGWQFAGWRDIGGNIVSTDLEHSFEIWGEIMLTAVFIEEDLDLDVDDDNDESVGSLDLLNPLDPLDQEAGLKNDEAEEVEADDSETGETDDGEEWGIELD